MDDLDRIIEQTNKKVEEEPPRYVVTFVNTIDDDAVEKIREAWREQIESSESVSIRIPTFEDNK